MKRSRIRPPAAGRLSVTTLACFDGGLAWPEIHKLTNGRGISWWTEMVGYAEDEGLLRWDAPHRCWRLTDLGRDYVRRQSVGAA